MALSDNTRVIYNEGLLKITYSLRPGRIGTTKLPTNATPLAFIKSIKNCFGNIATIQLHPDSIHLFVISGVKQDSVKTSKKIHPPGRSTRAASLKYCKHVTTGSPSKTLCPCTRSTDRSGVDESVTPSVFCAVTP